MKRKSIDEITLKYSDGTEEALYKGMLVVVDSNSAFRELRVKTFNFEENDLQEYLYGLMHFVAEKIDSDILDVLEKEVGI